MVAEANTPNGKAPHIGGGVALLPSNGEKQGADDLLARGWTWNDIQAFIYPMDEVFNMKTAEFAPKHLGGTSFTSSLLKGGSEVNEPLQVIPARQYPKEIEPRECVVAGIVPERHVTTFYGAGGSTKSILTLSLLLAAARGDKEWLGLFMSGRKYSTLFVDFELDLESQAERALKLIRGSGYKELPDGFNYVGAGGKNPPDVFEFLYRHCKDHPIDLMAIDSVGLAMLGDAGAYRDVVAFFRTLDVFRTDLSCTLILVDHQANVAAGESYQAKAAFGSSYKGNLSRSRVQIEPKEHGPGIRRVALRHNKANFTGYVDLFEVEVTFTEDAIKLEAVKMADETLVQEQVLPAWKRVLITLNAEDRPMDRADLAGSLSVTPGTVSNALTKLRANEYVENVSDGNKHLVKITTAGVDFVERFLNEYRDKGSFTSSTPLGNDEVNEPDDEGDDSEPPTDLLQPKGKMVAKPGPPTCCRAVRKPR